MSNLIDYSTIKQVFVSNSSQRLALTTNGQYYYWDNATQNYSLVDVSSLPAPSQIVGVDSDNAGNFYALTYLYRGSTIFGQEGYYLTSWNSTSQVWANPIRVPFGISGFYTTFSAINDNQGWLVNSDSSVQQYTWNATTQQFDLGDESFYGATQITIGKGDGSVWLLDNQGSLYGWDGTDFNLFNGGNNPAFQQIVSLNSQTLLGLDNNGNIYAWSSGANTFIELDNIIANLPVFSQIQIDETGILYGITNQSIPYQVGNISTILGLNNTSGQPFGMTTVTDGNGVTHALWNQDGQIYYGYQPSGTNGQYVGVTPLNSGIGSQSQGSAANLTLTKTQNGGVVASWIGGSGNNSEVYTSSPSSSIYGGYQWSSPTQLTDDELEDDNLEVVALGDNNILVTTRKNNQTVSQLVNISQLPVTVTDSNQLTFKPKGTEFTYSIVPGALDGASGIITLPNYVAISVEAGTGNLPKVFDSIKKKFGKYFKGFNIVADIDATTWKFSPQSPAAYNSLKLSAALKLGKVFSEYVDLNIAFFAQGTGAWKEITSYPSNVRAKAGGGFDLEVNALAMVLNSLFPGTGEALEVLSKQGVFSISAGPVLGLDLSFATSIKFDKNTKNIQPSDYFFKLVDKDGDPPTDDTPQAELFWHLDTNKFFSFLGDAFSSGDENFSLEIKTGLYVKTSGLKDFIKLDIKGVQTEEFNTQGFSGANYTNKIKVTVNLFFFSVSYVDYVRINDKVSGLTGESEIFQNYRGLPVRVSSEPISTIYLTQPGYAALLGEGVNDLIDSSDISYIIAPDGTTVYGTFTGSVDDNSANLSYLYFLNGTLGSNGVNWNASSLQAISNTAGANQRPNIALDTNGNVVITWQYESIDNPTVQQIATTPPGQVYVVYGQAGDNQVDLGTFAENPANANAAGFYWTLDNEYFASFGQAVTALGDVNSGGKADFAMTAPDLDDEQGGVYVVFAEDYNQVNDLNNLGSNGLLLTGQALSELGYSIANAGDVNGDGKSDLIIGAPGLNNNQGGAYLIYGGTLFDTPQSLTDIDTLLTNNPAYGQQITNPNGQAGDRFGSVVTGGYDFNGDSQADYAILSPNANQEAGETTLILSQSIANEVFTVSVNQNGNLVLFNQTTNNQVWSTNTSPPEPQYASYYQATMQSDGNFVLYEWAGLAQLSYWSTKTSGNQGAYLALGEDGGLYIRNQQGNNIHTLHQGTNPNTSRVSRLNEGNSIVSNNSNSNLTTQSYLGGTITLTNSTSAINGETLLDITSTALIPDINQDGKADLLIGGTGAAVILFGANLSTQTLDLGTINPGQGFVIFDDLDNPAPLQVSSAGDVNDDGINDVIVGYPATEDGNGNYITGNSYILFGSSSLSSTQNNSIGFSEINGTNGFSIIGAGTEVTGAGDLNGDGVADLLIAEPNGGNNQAGVSYVIYGGSSNNIGTVASINVSNIGTTVQGYVIGQGSANQLSGSSVSAVGDLNNDGKADLLIGAPNTVSSDALNQLQQTITSNYVIGQVSNGTLNTHNSTPTAIPWLQPGQSVQSLTSTPYGVLALWTTNTGSGETAQTSLSVAFWVPSGTTGNWKNYQSSVTTLSGSNLSFSSINVNNAANNAVTLNWVVLDSQTGTSSLGQSIYNGNNWSTANSIQTDSNPTPPDQIDNIISNSTTGSTSNSIFSVSHKTVKENEGKVTFTITRAGDINTSKTLNYRTVDISATAGADYEDKAGTLTFAPGETSKTIEVNIFDDNLLEHLNEKFKLILQDGQQTTLTAYATLQDTSQEINLLAIDSGFSMIGPVNDQLGQSLGSAGNVNGDTNSNNNNAPLDDFWISAPGANNSDGSVYLVFGSASVQVSDQGLDLNNPQSPQKVVKITGGTPSTSASPQSGSSLSSWVGSNNTWYAIAAPNLTNGGGTNDSNIYIFDKTVIPNTSSTVALNTLAASPLTGNSSDGFGETILLADLNGDGTPELIVGSPLGNQVKVYQLSGSGNNITTSLIATINAPSVGQGLGSALQVLDLNEDGKLDLAIGAPVVNPVSDPSNPQDIRGYGGAIYVLSGTQFNWSNTNASINLTSTSSTTNWVFDGITSFSSGSVNGKLNPSTGKPSSDPATNYAFYDGIGNAITSLDLNGDGHLDLVIGAPNAAVGATSNLGKVYVIFGNSGSLPSSLASIGAGQGVTFEGNLALGQAGWAVANGGDINNDKISDLLIGAPFSYGNAGSAYIVFGSTNAFSSGGAIYLDPNLTDSRVFQYQGVANPLSNSNPSNAGNVGQNLNGIGDINGDYGSITGGDDIILGAPSSNDGDGNSEAYVAIGHPWLQGGLSLNVNDLRSDNGFIVVNPYPGVSVGDVNGDGFDDFVNVSSSINPSGNQLTFGASTLTNVSGQRTYTLTANDSNLPSTNLITSPSTNLIAHGDFNADGYEDIVSGSINKTNGNTTELLVNMGNSITSNIIAGQTLYSFDIPDTVTTPIIQTCAGDINGDGYDDLIVLTGTNDDQPLVPNNYQIEYFLGSASGLSSQFQNYSLGTLGYAPGIGVADINADGVKEIITLEYAFNGYQSEVELQTQVSVYQFNNDIDLPLSELSLSFLNSPWTDSGTWYGDGFEITDTVAINSSISSGDFNSDNIEDTLISIAETSWSIIDGQQAYPIMHSTILYGTGTINNFGQFQTNIKYNQDSWNLYEPGNLPSPAVAVGDTNADGFDDILFDQGTAFTQSYIQLGSSEIIPYTPTTPPNTSLNSNTIVLGNGQNQIPIQGLPNRTLPYQTNTGGDVNGDAYQDIIITDTSNYDLTYVVYGQDWLTADEQNSGAETFTFFDGTNGNDVFTIPSNVTTPKIVLRGQNGDDFMLIPTANTSQIYAFGGEGDDQIGLGGEYGTDSKTIGKIDGGGGFDTIFVPQTVGQQTRLYLDTNAGRLFNIEAVDIGYNNSVQFNQSSLLQMLDGNKKLLINGASSSAYYSDSSTVPWTKLQTDAYDGAVYQIYGIKDTAIEVWIQQGINFTPLNNTAPSVQNPITDQTAIEDTGFNFPIPANTFVDVDLNDILTYSATLSNGNALPSWLNFDPKTRTFSGTPAYNDVGNLSLKVTATDKAVASISKTFTLQVFHPVLVPSGGGVIQGSLTNDLINASGKPGNYRLESGAGDDLLIGSNQRDILKGGIGNDSLYGEGNTDKLYGEEGDDLLDGGLALDFLYGGPGADSFVIRSGDGSDRILDFNSTEGDNFALSEMNFGQLSFNSNQIILGTEVLAYVTDNLGNLVTGFNNHPEWFVSL